VAGAPYNQEDSIYRIGERRSSVGRARACQARGRRFETDPRYRINLIDSHLLFVRVNPDFPGRDWNHRLTYGHLAVTAAVMFILMAMIHG
jgi:hypothetical protein